MSQQINQSLSIFTEQSNLTLLKTKYEKASMPDKTIELVEQMVVFKNRSNVTLDDISLSLNIRRSRLTKLIKDAGFSWSNRSRNYSKQNPDEFKRVSLNAKKKRKSKIFILLNSTSWKILDYLINTKKVSSDELFENLLSKEFEQLNLSSTKVIDIMAQ
jgi:hypothetical protein